MSDFFAGVTGFKFPDTLRDKGPLPSVAGAPVGCNGTPDAVINGTSSLLQNITPYAKGESARMGSDSNYQQIPWRMQYIVPQLFIPSFHEYESSIPVSHAVDQGDIAFRLYTKDRAWLTTNSTANVLSHAALRPAALVCFGNLDIVNYVLACMQHSTSATWDCMREHMTYKKTGSEHEKFVAVKRLVRQNFTPHGICAGSEHQGGKHESSHSNASIQPGRAVNFVTTMTVDGKNEDLVNYWYRQDLSAGDTLLFTLEKIPARDINAREYHLTRYYKQPVRRSVLLPDTAACWQLVARVHRVSDPLPKEEDMPYDYRFAGYWRIAQTFQCRRLSISSRGQLSGPLLEVTFAPVWVDFQFCEQKKRPKKRAASPSSSGSSSKSSDPSSSDGSSVGGSSSWSVPSVPGGGGKDLKFPPLKKKKGPAGPP